jgi:hypothetical protein
LKQQVVLREVVSSLYILLQMTVVVCMEVVVEVEVEAGAAAVNRVMCRNGKWVVVVVEGEEEEEGEVVNMQLHHQLTE